MTQRIRKNFDLPTRHLGPEGHYVPPKARDEAEIARRRAMRSGRGILMAEQQEFGVKVGALILEHPQAAEDIAFTSPILAASGINTAWFSFGRTLDVMRRELKLPHPSQRRPITTDGLLEDAQLGFFEAAHSAEKITKQARKGGLEYANHAIPFGRAIGNASLKLACVTLADTLVGLDEVTTSEVIRRHCLQTLQTSRDLSTVIGSAPSLAQLANPDSDLSVHWRRTAPNGAVEAYEQAVAMLTTPVEFPQ